MGGKARAIFGTVLTLAAVLATGGALAPWGVTAVGAMWISGAAVAYGAFSAVDAAKKARRGLKTNLTGSPEGADRMTMIRGGTSAKAFVYGWQWVTGNIVYWRPAQSKEDPYAWLVLALPIAHEIASFENIYFGEQPLFPLDPAGYPPPGPFNQDYTNTFTMRGTTNGGDIPLEVHAFDADEDDWAVEPDSITCTLYKTVWERVANDEGTYQTRVDERPMVIVTIRPGGRSVYINFEAGWTFVLTYRYRFTKHSIKVFTYTGSPDQLANADLIEATKNIPGRQWTSDHRLRGIPYVILRILPDMEVFPREIENITCLLRGKKDILDTRTGLSGFTVNPVLCARDYAVERCNVPPGAINLPLLNAHANICDEPITEPSLTVPGATVKMQRYEVHIQLSTEQLPKDNLGDILSACDGSAVWSGPSFDIRAGAYENPVLFLDDSDLAGPPEVSKSPPRFDVINAVYATYRNSAKLFWPVEEAPGYASVFYRQQDGDIHLPRELQFPGVVHVYQVQRLLKQTLHRERSSLRLRVRVTIRGVEIGAEMVIGMTIKVLGFEVKPFRVKAWEWIAHDVYLLELQEDGSGIYYWNHQEGRITDPTPNSNLPRVRVVPVITGLTAVTNETAAAFGPNGDLQAMCHVMWNPVTDPLVLSGGWIQLRHKRSTDVDWTESPKLQPDTTDYRFPIRRGDVLLIEARCANAFVPGRWSYYRKMADDAPTPWVVGNWIHNAQFAFPQQFTQPPWPAPIEFEGWTFPTTSDKGQGVITEPFYTLAGLPGAGFDPRNVQVIVQKVDGPIVVDEWINGWTAKMPSPPPGTRVCGMVDHWNNAYGGGGFGYIEVIFFDASDMLIEGWMSTGLEGRPIGDGNVESEDLKQILLFVKVPVGASLMRLALWHHRAAIGTGGSTIAVWRHPYLGPASERQITAPPWTK